MRWSLPLALRSCVSSPCLLRWLSPPYGPSLLLCIPTSGLCPLLWAWWLELGCTSCDRCGGGGGRFSCLLPLLAFLAAFSAFLAAFTSFFASFFASCCSFSACTCESRRML
jgi:hypothetical protein